MQVSGYPSNSIAINISSDTMSKVLLEMEGIDPMIAKLQNINLIFGKVNSLEYCSTIFNFPKLYDIYGNVSGRDIPDIDQSMLESTDVEEIDTIEDE